MKAADWDVHSELAMWINPKMVLDDLEEAEIIWKGLYILALLVPQAPVPVDSI